MPPQLADRELELTTALVRTLAIFEKTVRNHVSNIRKKLHVYNRTWAVLYATREGLVEVDGMGR